MAQVSIVKKMSVAAIALAAIATASAQELAPAPSPDAGAAFSLPISAAVLGASLLCSAFGLLRH